MSAQVSDRSCPRTASVPSEQTGVPLIDWSCMPATLQTVVQSPVDKVAPSAEDKCEQSPGEECAITDVESGKVMVMLLWIIYYLD